MTREEMRLREFISHTSGEAEASYGQLAHPLLVPDFSLGGYRDRITLLCDGGGSGDCGTGQNDVKRRDDTICSHNLTQCRSGRLGALR